MRKPFYRKDRDAWYVKVDGGNSAVKLHQEEDAAFRIWTEMLDVGTSINNTFESVSISFLGATEDELKPGTWKRYTSYIGSLSRHLGPIKVLDLKPFHVTEWLQKHPQWGASSRRFAIAAVKRCLNWSVEQGLIQLNPLAHVKRPPNVSRDCTITREEYQTLVNAADPKFRLVLIALWHTGTRPSMVAAVTTENVRGKSWVMHEHKTRKRTGRPLRIYLTPCLQALTNSIVATRTEGQRLFLNRDGNPWTVRSIQQRMKRLSIKTGVKVIPYSFRHSFATDLLKRGESPAVVAELMGHGDIKMIQDHYGHLQDEPEHLVQAVANR